MICIFATGKYSIGRTLHHVTEKFREGWMASMLVEKNDSMSNFLRRIVATVSLSSGNNGCHESY